MTEAYSSNMTHAHHHKDGFLKRDSFENIGSLGSPTHMRHAFSPIAPNGLKEFSSAFEPVSTLYKGANSSVLVVKHKASSQMKVAKFLIPNASTLEIKILNYLKGRGNCIRLEDCTFNTATNQYVLIFPYVDLPSPNQSTMNAKELKMYMFELLKTLAFCHGNKIVHCDLKPDNTMYSNGAFCLIDFGHAAMCLGNTQKASLKACNRYMAPELQQTSTTYDTAIDVWAAAVIMTEKIFNVTFKDSREIYFFVKNVAQQPELVREKLRNTAYSQTAVELLVQMLRWDPSHRMSAHDAVQHPYFDDCRHPPNVTQSAYLQTTI